MVIIPSHLLSTRDMQSSLQKCFVTSVNLPQQKQALLPSPFIDEKTKAQDG